MATIRQRHDLKIGDVQPVPGGFLREKVAVGGILKVEASIWAGTARETGSACQMRTDGGPRNLGVFSIGSRKRALSVAYQCCMNVTINPKSSFMDLH